MYRHQPLEGGKGVNNSLGLDLGRCTWQQVTDFSHDNEPAVTQYSDCPKHSAARSSLLFKVLVYNDVSDICNGRQLPFVLPSSQSLVGTRHYANST